MDHVREHAKATIKPLLYFFQNDAVCMLDETGNEESKFCSGRCGHTKSILRIVTGTKHELVVLTLTL